MIGVYREIEGSMRLAARGALGEALAIDRELGIPRRIFLDLLGLGGASKLLGDRRAARGYHARAQAVSEASHDAAGIAEARALIDALDKQ